MDATQGCTEGLKEALVAYVYNECDETERERVASHVATCAACSSELDALQSVRGALDLWEAPEPALGFRLVADRDRSAPWWRRAIEASWGLAAAAGLVLVVAAAIASVEVRYDASGVVLRMGWAARARTEIPEPVPQSDVEPATAAEVGTDDRTPWHADLVRLEGELRQALDTESVSQPVIPPETNHSALLKEIERLIAQSERRQKQEVAVWFTQFAQEHDMLRRADQQRFQQDLGALEGVTDYLVKVSQR